MIATITLQFGSVNKVFIIQTDSSVNMFMAGIQSRVRLFLGKSKSAFLNPKTDVMCCRVAVITWASQSCSFLKKRLDNTFRVFLTR